MGSNISEYGELSPEWYWKKGLHDAHVVGISSQVFGYDPILRASNYAEIKLDASQAMFDTTIKAIKLFNCKVLTPGLDIEGMWWVRDKLYFSEKSMCWKLSCVPSKFSVIMFCVLTIVKWNVD